MSTNEIDLNSVAQNSYSGVFNTRNHVQDLASRILTATAFFTAAAAQVHAQSFERLKHGPTAVWPTRFFGAYLLFVTLGGLFLLGALWPAVWNRVHDQKNPDYIHTFSHPKNARRYDSLSDITADTYSKEILNAYLRERDYILDDSTAVTELLRWGGISLMLAFFSFVLLTSTLFFTPKCADWLISGFGIAILCGAMAAGSFVRQFNTSPRYRPRLDLTPWVWLAMVAVVLIGFAFVADVSPCREATPPETPPSASH